MPTATGTSSTPCVCCTPGTRCFQIWSKSWDCVTSTWSAATLVGRPCLDPETKTGWRRTPEGCTWHFYRDMGVDCADVECGSTAEDPPGDDPPNHDGCCRHGGCCALYFTITFVNVETNTPCRPECGGQVGGGGTLTSYRVYLQPAAACFWLYESPDEGPGCGNLAGEDCDGAGTMDNSILLQLVLFPSSSFTATTSDGKSLFNAIIPFDEECCKERIVENANTSYDCGVYGINGYAIITPGPCA